MLAVASRRGQRGILLATAVALSIWSTAARAYTPEQQQACTGDAFRLCSSDIPDVDRITVCMIRNKSQLSPACRAHFRAGPEPGEVSARPAGRPTVIRPAAPHKAAAAKPRKKPKKPAT